MKKILAITLSALLTLSFAACGGSEEEAKPAVTPTQAPTATPEVVTTAPETAAPETAAPETAAPETVALETAAPEPEAGDDVQATVDLILSMKGQPVEDLYDLIGEPNDTDYATSCLVEGEDGMLFYDGFTVYTLAPTDGEETIYDCIPAE